MRISNQRALEIMTDIPKSQKTYPITNDDPRSWIPLATFCGMSVGSSILFMAIDAIFLKTGEWITYPSSDNFVHLLQMMMLAMIVMVLVLMGFAFVYYHKRQLTWIESAFLLTFIGLIISFVPEAGILGSLLMFISGVWTTVRVVRMTWAS